MLAEGLEDPGSPRDVDDGLAEIGEIGVELNVTAAWLPDDDDDRHRAWALRPYSTGVYASFLSGEDAAGVKAAYGDRLTRLTALKDRYDPTNALRLNANIPPGN